MTEGEAFEGLFSDPLTGGAGRRGDPHCVELCPICRTADLMRATMPPELQEHWRAAQRELLLAVRSLVDHYVQHLDRERASGVSVEDIPIE